ncbi:hypothetical protein CL659_01785 [bacterium]|nr:hypothetical protein [bacterium]|tara:strand:+ start:3278 stop:3952 length:675 start_codon:yes stop_codon:yes gene_type:complete
MKNFFVLFSIVFLYACGGGGSGPVTDVDPPHTVLLDPPSGYHGSATLSFSFQADEDNCTFECRLCPNTNCQNSTVSWQSCISPVNYTVLSDGSQNFEVKATDSAGNEEPHNPPHGGINWTLTVDLTDPEVTISESPDYISGEIVGFAPFTANFAYDGTDNYFVAEYWCRLTGLQNPVWEICNGGAISYPDLPFGDYEFEVNVKDGAGNTSDNASFEFVVNQVFQ